MKRILSMLAGFVLVAGVALAADACPSCKESIPNSDAVSPQGVANGINNSIYLMLGAFLAVLGFIGHISYKAIRSSDQSRRGFPMK